MSEPRLQSFNHSTNIIILFLNNKRNYVIVAMLLAHEGGASIMRK